MNYLEKSAGDIEIEEMFRSFCEDADVTSENRDAQDNHSDQRRQRKKSDEYSA